jgi:hypothetical protein
LNYESVTANEYSKFKNKKFETIKHYEEELKKNELVDMENEIEDGPS